LRPTYSRIHKPPGQHHRSSRLRHTLHAPGRWERGPRAGRAYTAPGPAAPRGSRLPCRAPVARPPQPAQRLTALAQVVRALLQWRQLALLAATRVHPRIRPRARFLHGTRFLAFHRPRFPRFLRRPNCRRLRCRSRRRLRCPSCRRLLCRSCPHLRCPSRRPLGCRSCPILAYPNRLPFRYRRPRPFRWRGRRRHLCPSCRRLPCRSLLCLRSRSLRPLRCRSYRPALCRSRHRLPRPRSSIGLCRSRALTTSFTLRSSFCLSARVRVPTVA
jgi:hypothetical protein